MERRTTRKKSRKMSKARVAGEKREKATVTVLSRETKVGKEEIRAMQSIPSYESFKARNVRMLRESQVS
jgi:hypothetical protein